MQHSLEVKISAAGLEQISSQNGVIVIANSIVSPQAKPVAWFTFPATSDTTIVWNDASDAYWSEQTSLAAGEAITVAGSRAISLGNTYTLESNGTFVSKLGGPPGGIMLLNQSGATRVLGMLGFAQVAGQQVSGPCSAAVVWQNSETEVFPVNQIYIFVASGVENGTVLSDFPPNTLTVETNRSETVVYNPNTHTFQQAI